MTIQIREGDIHLQDTRTRLPFRYGIVTMTSAPHLFLRLHVDIEGRRFSGIAADGLPPKWFTKDPTRLVEDELHEMLRVIEQALAFAVGRRADTPLGLLNEVRLAQEAWGQRENLPPLLTQFGTSLVERAFLEAFCRACGRPFSEIVRDSAFGLTFSQGSPGQVFPKAPLSRVIVRHTVGLLDPLTDDEIAPADRLDDGLPQSLAASITTYGLRHFKIKLFGEVQRDQERLRRIAEVLTAHAPADYAFSLDGNETFQSLAEFLCFWEVIREQPDLHNFLSRLLFIEQPLHRRVALDPAIAGRLRDWQERPAILIDESDADSDSWLRACALGYAGTSHKNCKGVLKSLVNFSRIEAFRRGSPDRPYLMSGEDLANIGPVALLQDLAVCATLGIDSVERNGHHYFAGLSLWPTDIQDLVLKHHGDLYCRSRDGWPTLRISNGTVSVDSLVKAPFGVGFAVPVERFLTPDAWRVARH